jgi:hypothetical protein
MAGNMKSLLPAAAMACANSARVVSVKRHIIGLPILRVRQEPIRVEATEMHISLFCNDHFSQAFACQD